MFGSIPFIEGTLSKRAEPLSQYLPQIQDGICSTWLQKNVPVGACILDPFGASPKVAIEAARAGYPVIVSANNPITRFILEMLADPPKPEDMQASLAELAASYVGNERIEPHIRSLYNTVCARCGSLISAEAFFWEHGNPSPYIRIYTCPFCGDTGEHACTAADIELASQFSISGMHKARALERVVSATDQDRIHVEQALSVYMPRALYVLITIINKIEGLQATPLHQKCLSALLLHAFDQATATWRVPAQKERRRQLTIPRHYRENNIWISLEEGIKLWSTADSSDMPVSVPVTAWPQLPPSTGGICIFTGRYASLAESVKNIGIRVVCSVIPRPNQAFWTLSALWAGWLWGRDAVGSFRSVLHRQRYDWAWHTAALFSVFKQLVLTLDDDTPIFGIVNEAEPGLLGATLVAAGMSGCRLETIAIRAEQAHAQIFWNSHHIAPSISPDIGYAHAASLYAKRYLEGRAEPAAYIKTISAAFMGIINSWQAEHPMTTDGEINDLQRIPALENIDQQDELSPSAMYSSVYNTAREVLSYRSGFLLYGLQDVTTVEAPSKNSITQNSFLSVASDNIVVEDETTVLTQVNSVEIEQGADREKPTRSSEVSSSALIWLREPDPSDQTPITDRYEQKLVSQLIDHPGTTLIEIDTALCQAFPGLFTPQLEFIELCLESYALPSSADNNRWYLRPEDAPVERQRDLEHAARFIQEIGERLGFVCKQQRTPQSKPSLVWSNGDNMPEYRFFPNTSAAITDIVLTQNLSSMKGIIVLPASRANILVYKLRRDPRLSRAFHPTQGNWHFLKFRHLRSLADSPVLNRENLDQLLSLDPISFTTPQLWLI